MCGIAGIWALESGQASIRMVRSMLPHLRHRGPDSYGIWSDSGHCDTPVLGHTRLPIQDLSENGSQPMSSACGRFVISLNGEIYNHWDLRDRLGGAVRWRSTSDTETLLEAISRWGLSTTLKRVNGVFAVALWDSADRRVLLARDRIGEKPLYVGEHGGRFVFASELGAILNAGLGPFRIDGEAVQGLLNLGYVPDPRSILSGIHKLEPGTFLEVRSSADGFKIRQEAYWTLESCMNAALEHRRERTIGAWLDELEIALERAVERQLIADVPLGAFLSGGIDSGLVVSKMASVASGALQTFTVKMPPPRDESQRAQQLADHLGTSHTEIPITEQDCIDVIPHLSRFFSEPLGDSSQIPMYLVSKVTREHVTVALSGDGGDELFAGYHRHFMARRIWNRLSRFPESVRRATAAAAGSVLGERAAMLASVLASGGGTNERRMLRIQKGSRLAGSQDVPDLYRRLVTQWPRSRSPVRGVKEWQVALPAWAGRMERLDPVERLMAYDLSMALPGDMLVKVDRAAMAHALETRMPFLDHEFIGVALSVPVDLKVKGRQGKWILRKLLERHAPKGWMDEPEARQKSGFGIPINRWLRGELRPWAESLLSRSKLKQTPYLDPDVVDERWNELQRGTGAWQHPIWSILSFQAWIDEYREHLIID